MYAKADQQRSIWWKGEENQQSESGVICAGHFHSMPNHQAHRKGINQWVVLYCVEGAGEVSMGNDSPTPAQCGRLFCLPPNTPHYYKTSPQLPWTLYWFHCSGLMEPEVMEQLPFYVDVGVTGELVDSFTQLLQEMEQPFSALRTIKCRALAQLILIRCIEAKTHNSLMEQARSYIEANCTQELYIGQLAATFGLSKFHFVRVFRDSVGLPPNRYQVVCRIRAACKLLANPSLSIQQISEQLNYQSVYYLSRQFKLTTGYAPSEYRAQVLKL